MRAPADETGGYAYRYAPRRPRPLRRFLTIAFLAVCATLAYMHLVGIPEWIVKYVRRELADAGLAFESSAVRLDLRHGIVLHDARLFRVGVVGVPAAEARSVVFGLDVLSFMRRESVLKSVRISDGCVRPRTLYEVERDRPRQPRTREARTPLVVRVDLRNCEVAGTGIERLTCLFEEQGSTVFCRKVDGRLRRDDMAGDVSGSLQYDTATRVLDAHAETLLNLHLALPVFDYFGMPVTAKLLRRFDFGATPPRCEFDIHCELGGEPLTTLDGTFWIKDASYRGVDLLRGDGTIHVTLSHSNSVAVVDPLFLVRPEGMARGGFFIDFDKGVVEFHGRTSFHPAALSQMIGVMTNEIREWTFDGPVSIAAEGVADLNGWEDMAFTVDFEGRQCGYSNLVAELCTFDAVFNGPTITVSAVEGRMYDGALEAEAQLVAPVGAVSNARYHVEASLYRADFEQIARMLAGNGPEDYDGRFTMMFDVSGWLGEGNAKTAAGTGALGVDDGRVFMLPVFGGLSRYMTKIIPGLDFVLKQSDANANFTVQKGQVSSEEINIKGDVLSLSGKGTYHLDGKLDFEIQMRLLKTHTIGGRILRPLFYPLSKLFEFRLKGTMDAPDWYLINFSSDVLERLGLKKKER